MDGAFYDTKTLSSVPELLAAGGVTLCHPSSGLFPRHLLWTMCGYWARGATGPTEGGGIYHDGPISQVEIKSKVVFTIG